MKITKQLFTTLWIFILFTGFAQAKPPFIEHKNGYFKDGEILLTACIKQGKEAFSQLNIQTKKSTNARNEVVGFTENYKIVFYCVDAEYDCDAPEGDHASGGTIIAAGSNYTETAKWIDKVFKAMNLRMASEEDMGNEEE